MTNDKEQKLKAAAEEILQKRFPEPVRNFIGRPNVPIILSAMEEYAALVSSEEAKEIERLKDDLSRKYKEWENQRQTIRDFHEVFWKHFGLNNMADPDSLNEKIYELKSQLEAKAVDAVEFAEWIFEECDTATGQFPHKHCGFWHKESQKYYTTEELYQQYLKEKK